MITANPHTAIPAPPNPGWHRLRQFNYYRGTLALFLLVVYLNDWVEMLVPASDFQPLLFSIAALFYLSSFVVFIAFIHRQKPGLKTQAIVLTCIDIAAITLLMHAFGGVKSGLGMLLIINISMTSLFMPRQLTLLFAAVATLAILGSQIYSQLVIPEFQPSYVPSGILGLVIFGFAFITSNFSRRLRDTEQLADNQGRELETATQLNEHIIRSMRTGILVLSPEGNILMSNNAADSILGHAQLSPATPLKTISPALHERFTDWQTSQEYLQLPIEQSHGLPDIQPGFSAIEKDRGTQGQTLVFLEDASQLNQRFQQVKLASLGRLTASIAHEIRNPLAAIQHASQLLEESTAEPGNLKLARIIITHTQRLNGVVNNVLQLSRKPAHKPEIINLKSWLDQFKREFCPSHGMNAQQIEIKVMPESIAILFDPDQLYQIFWNLCANAVNHSGLDSSQLSIKLHASIAEQTQQPVIDIIDNGQGIAEDIEAHIFEPFYTTSGEGTGLGLYIIKEMAENNRAKIKHIARPDNGSCFRIYFLPTRGPAIQEQKQQIMENPH